MERYGNLLGIRLKLLNDFCDFYRNFLEMKKLDTEF